MGTVLSKNMHDSQTGGISLQIVQNGIILHFDHIAAPDYALVDSRAAFVADIATAGHADFELIDFANFYVAATRYAYLAGGCV